MKKATTTGSASPSRRRWAVVWTLGSLVLLAIGLASGDFGDLFLQAIAKVTPLQVLATFPGQIAAFILYAGALRALRPGVTYWGCLGARMLRDAADNLLVLFPGLGEVIGARALVLAGARSRTAVTVTMLDKLVETAAQLPFMALAGFVLLHNWNGRNGSPFESISVSGGTVAGLAGVVVFALLARSFIRSSDGPTRRLASRIREEIRLAVAEFHHQRSGIPLAMALHFLAWLTDGVQVWMAAQAFGLDLGLFDAVVMASAGYALRVMAFFIPAGLVAQEAGFVAAGLVLGFAAPGSLTLSLVLRVRDIAFGVPLLLWPAYEYRHGNRMRERSVHG